MSKTLIVSKDTLVIFKGVGNEVSVSEACILSSPSTFPSSELDLRLYSGEVGFGGREESSARTTRLGPVLKY